MVTHHHAAAATASIVNKAVQHAPAFLLPKWMLEERTKCITPPELVPPKPSTFKQEQQEQSQERCIVYWMQREMRTVDNWALLWAASLARTYQLPLHVVYTLQPPPTPNPNDDDDDDDDDKKEKFPLPPSLIEMPMTARHGHFLLGGLEHVHAELKELDIPFHVLLPPSHAQVGETFCQFVLEQAKKKALVVVSDFSPLRHARQWMELQAAPLLEKAKVPLYQVDAHNIVPVWIAGEGRRQIGARTLRPRIHRAIDKYLQDFPTLEKMYQQSSTAKVELPEFDRSLYEEFLQMDQSVPPVDDWAIPGTKAGMKQYESFVRHGLKTYNDQRNDPTQQKVCSNLSHWANHGHISYHRITMEVQKLNKHANGKSSFVEESVVRRELSDNFLYYTPNDYDALTGALEWAQETLQEHAKDKRPWLYTLQQLQDALTHDDLWNAAQLQLVQEGQMHGFLRMYWAKKILEWTISPEFALRAAQYFNDKYALDGKDPNGFVGVGWSIMGIHDQGWKEREIFGKIRYMNYQGCKRKFNVAQFVALYPEAAHNAAKASGQSTLQLGKATTNGSSSSTDKKPTNKAAGQKRLAQSTIPSSLRKKLK
ncbi:hypothetical protein ACA910_015503 [Epithemia clementina (nom. ined.)]